MEEHPGRRCSDVSSEWYGQFGQPIGGHRGVVVDESHEIERRKKFTAAASSAPNTEIASSCESEVSHRLENPHLRKLEAHSPHHVIQRTIVDEYDFETIRRPIRPEDGPDALESHVDAVVSQNDDSDEQCRLVHGDSI
jgi:hypothetical protein